MFLSKINTDDIHEFLKHEDEDTKIYIGADSERFRKGDKWYADYSVAIVVHRGGRNGCKVFGEIQREIDHDQVIDRPFNRMMSEAMKAADMYLRTKELFYDYEVQVHLDIASDEMQGSNCAVKAAAGYVLGTCQTKPLVKPDAFAASYAADRLKHIMSYKAA